MIFKNNKTFDFLKWLAVIVLPAIGWAYSELGATWGLPYAAEVTKTFDILGTLLGIFLGVSTYRYNHQDELEGQNGIQDTDE